MSKENVTSSDTSTQWSVMPDCGEVELYCSEAAEATQSCEEELVSLPADHYKSVTLNDEYLLKRTDLEDLYEANKHLCREIVKKEPEGEPKTFWKMTQEFKQRLEQRIVPDCETTAGPTGPVEEVSDVLKLEQEASKTVYKIALSNEWFFSLPYVDELFPKGLTPFEIGRQICVKPSTDSQGQSTLIWRIAKAAFDTIVKNTSPELQELSIPKGHPQANMIRALVNLEKWAASTDSEDQKKLHLLVTEGRFEYTDKDGNSQIVSVPELKGTQRFQSLPVTAFDEEWIPLGYLGPNEAAMARIKFNAIGQRSGLMRQASSPDKEGKAQFYVSVRVAQKGALEWEGDLSVIRQAGWEASSEDGMRAAKLQENLAILLTHPRIKDVPSLPVDLDQFPQAYWQGGEIAALHAEQYIVDTFEGLDPDEYIFFGDLYAPDRTMLVGTLAFRGKDFPLDKYWWQSAIPLVEKVFGKDVIDDSDLESLMVCQPNELSDTSLAKGSQSCFIKRAAAGRQWKGMIDSLGAAVGTKGIDAVEKRRRSEILAMALDTQARIKEEAFYYIFRVHGLPIALAFVTPTAAWQIVKHRADIKEAAKRGWEKIRNRWGRGGGNGDGSGGSRSSSRPARQLELPNLNPGQLTLPLPGMQTSQAMQAQSAMAQQTVANSSQMTTSTGINWMAGARTFGWGIAMIGSGLLTAISGAGTGIAAACPVDGPVGEAALGTATVASAGMTASAATAFVYSGAQFWDSLWN